MIPLTLPLVDFLLTAEAQAALAELASQELNDQASLPLLTRLRRVWSPDQAAALLDQARLRRKAGDKFPQPERLLFTDEALQQASSRAVAAYRAQQFLRALGRRNAESGEHFRIACFTGFTQQGEIILTVVCFPRRSAI